MIASVLESIAERLKMYMESMYGGSAPKVISSALVNQSNELIPEPTDKQIIVTLINVEEETYGTVRDYTNKPVHISLSVLISVMAESDYIESLNYLSSVIQFFQANVVLEQSNTPQLHESISKLDFSIVNSDLRDIGGLWGALGAKHLPSVVYKVRAITFSSDSASGGFRLG